MSTDKSACYRDLVRQLAALLAGESDRIANAANMAALIYDGLPDLNWAGFYFRQGAELVLGPFQGKPACLRIPIGQGVCGTAAARRASVLVADVHEFPGHIACDPVSRSELVVPLIEGGEVTGVLDLDSPLPARFGATDREGCERLVALFIAHHRPKPDAADHPDDIDPQSGCRLPLPQRDDLDEEGQRLYDRLADPAGGTLRGLRGPGGIQLHSPRLARHSRPLNHYLRHETGLGARLRELAILVTARECVGRRGDTAGLDEADAIVIALGREVFGARRLAPKTFARALRQFGRRMLVDLVALMGNYAATAALLTAFDMQLDEGVPAPF
jgi:L-methionine (R)-S-oxide reductase